MNQGPHTCGEHPLVGGNALDEQLVLHDAQLRHLQRCKRWLDDGAQVAQACMGTAARAAHARLPVPFDRTAMHGDLEPLQALHAAPDRLEAAHACGAYRAAVQACVAWHSAAAGTPDDRKRVSAATTLLSACLEEATQGAREAITQWTRQGHLPGTDLAELRVWRSRGGFVLFWRLRSTGELLPK